MKAFLVTFILASVSALAMGIGNDTDEEHQPNNIITNGYAAPEGKAPYLVSLEFRKEGSNVITICGGSIIGHTWVVTAAHCLTGDYVDINYGSNWRGRGAFKHSVRNDQWIRNSLWPNTNGNDIALLRTPHVDFTSTVNKVNLPKLSQRNERFENWWAVTCGWGGQANGKLADWLQCADLQIISNDECSRSYGSIPEGILCVRTPGGKSTCGGDSGGSLVTHDNPILVGITSFVSGAGCTAGHPAGFTRVTVHLDWIRQHTGIVYN